MFLGVHIATSVLDPFAAISWTDAVIPLSASYRPFWLGLGAVAFDLLIALAITSLLRVRIGLRTWRGIHWLAYACWPVALVHGLGTGSDVRSRWLLWLVAGCVADDRGRRLGAAGGHAGRRAALAASAWVSPCWSPRCCSAGWLETGPLQPGWAGHAGTPTPLLHHAPRASG